jgi:hypothetical protein
MTTKIVPVDPNGQQLPINPQTGMPFKSIAELVGHEHYQRMSAHVALNYHLYHRTKGQTHRR